MSCLTHGSKTAYELSITELEQVLHDKRMSQAVFAISRMDAIQSELDEIGKRRMFLRKEFADLQFTQAECPNRKKHTYPDRDSTCSYCREA